MPVSMQGDDRRAAGTVVGADDKWTAEQTLALQRQTGTRQGSVVRHRPVLKDVEYISQAFRQMLDGVGIKRLLQPFGFGPGRIEQMVRLNISAWLQPDNCWVKAAVAQVNGFR